MAALTFQQEHDRSTARSPFTNGGEGERWMQRWCEEGCINLDDCTLLTVALVTNRTPAAWIKHEPGNTYACTEYDDGSPAC